MPKPSTISEAMTPLEFDRGIHEIGYEGGSFCFDNELPRHQVLLRSGALDDKLITNGEYLEFMNQGGYQRPESWLSEGWHWVQTQQWIAPLYWIRQEQKWFVMTLMGLQPLNLDEPVSHVSYYEADAFARWRGEEFTHRSRMGSGRAKSVYTGSFCGCEALSSTGE